jgi:DNA-binding MarR family transcriptional regulator
VASRRSKSVLVDELIREFRASTNQDLAFEKLAAAQLGVNETDLHCMNIIENSGGLSAGELAAQSGLTAGAVTGVIDRLERTGFARRIPDASDRRRVIVEVTPAFYERADRIWGPLAADWHSTLTVRFTANELRRIRDFLQAADDLSRRHVERLRQGGDGRRLPAPARGTYGARRNGG